MGEHITKTERVWTSDYKASCSCGWARRALCTAEADRYATEHEDRKSPAVPEDTPGQPADRMEDKR